MLATRHQDDQDYLWTSVFTWRIKKEDIFVDHDYFVNCVDWNWKNKGMRESIKGTVDWKWMLYLQHEVDFCLCHSPQLNMIFHAILASLGFLENIDQDMNQILGVYIIEKPMLFWCCFFFHRECSSGWIMEPTLTLFWIQILFSPITVIF